MVALVRTGRSVEILAREYDPCAATIGYPQVQLSLAVAHGAELRHRLVQLDQTQGTLTKPVVGLNVNSTFIARRVWIAALLKLDRRLRLLAGGGRHAIAGKNQVDSDPRCLSASL